MATSYAAARRRSRRERGFNHSSCSRLANKGHWIQLQISSKHYVNTHANTTTVTAVWEQSSSRPKSLHSFKNPPPPQPLPASITIPHFRHYRRYTLTTRSRVYATIRCPSVRLSVRLSLFSTGTQQQTRGPIVPRCQRTYETPTCYV